LRWGGETEEKENGMKGVGGAEHGRGGVNVKATLVAVNMVNGGSVTEKNLRVEVLFNLEC